MKKYTVITIIVAALLSIFLLGMNPVNQPSQLKDGIWQSDSIEGFENAYSVVFHTEAGSTSYVVQDNVSFGEYLPEVPAKEGMRGYWLIDGTVDSILTADTPLTCNMSVTAAYEPVQGGAPDYMEGQSGVLQNIGTGKLVTSEISPKRNYALAGVLVNDVTDVTKLPVWSFIYVGSYDTNLNYYYVTSSAGYLHIDPADGTTTGANQGKISISGDPQKIIVEKTNSTIKLMSSANKLFALDHSGSNKDIHSWKEGQSSAFTLYTDPIKGKSAVKVTFNPNGGTVIIPSVSAFEGNTILMPDYTGTRYGFQFLGWSLDRNAAEPNYEPTAPYTIGDTDVTFYAVWQRTDPVTITLDASGGTPATTTFSQYPGVTVDLSAYLPENGEHEFLGWTDDTGTKVADAAKYVVPNADATLTASWDIFVNIYANGGTGDDSLILTPGEELDLSEISVSNGLHQLKGWAETADADVVKYQPDAVITPSEDTDLYAVWDTENIYVTFYDGETLVDSVSYPSDEIPATVEFPELDARGEDYDFLGWSETRGTIEPEYGADAAGFPGPAEDTAMYASWGHWVNVTFQAEDATVDPTFIRDYAGKTHNLSEITLTNDPGNTSDLSYWYDGENSYLGTADYVIPDADTTLTAVWTARRYTVTFDVNGGSGDAPAPQTNFKEGYITIPASEITREGYEFLGWSETKSYNTMPTGSSIYYQDIYNTGDQYKLKYDHDVTLYASWSKANDPLIGAKFGIRLDGLIPNEPSSQSTTDYTTNQFPGYGNKEVGNPGNIFKWGIVAQQRWVVDTDLSEKNLNGHYKQNQVTAALGNDPANFPTVAEIQQMTSGNFDPDTQYVVWYVMKYQGAKADEYAKRGDPECEGKTNFDANDYCLNSSGKKIVKKSAGTHNGCYIFNIDGVIVSKLNNYVYFKEGLPKSEVSNMPSNYSFIIPKDGSGNPIPQTIYAGGSLKKDGNISNVNDYTYRDPAASGHVFLGWKVEGGDDRIYKKKDALDNVTGDVTFVAQWRSESYDATSTVTKKWEGDTGYNIRPESVNVYLEKKVNGAWVETGIRTTLTPDNEGTWTYTVSGLKKYASETAESVGEEIKYRWREEAGTVPAKYTTSYNDNESMNATVITNKFTPVRVLTVTKEAGTKTGLEAGQTVNYTITVAAGSNNNVTISGLTLEDALEGVTLGNLSATALAPGETATASAAYDIKQSDVDAGSVTNTVTVKGTDPAGVEVSDDDDETVTTVAADPELTLTKAAVIKDANGTEKQKAAVGDIVTYTVTVENTGNVTVSNIVLTDSKMPEEKVPAAFTLAPQDDALVVTYTYTVTQDDVDAGSFSNTASAAGKDPEDGDVPAGPVTVTVYTEDYAAELTLTKTAVITGSDGTVKEKAAVGDTVTYTVTVENTGNVTVSNIVLTDSMMPEEKVPAAFTLAPGEDKSVEYTYTVTQADVDAGSFSNTASAEGKDPKGGDVPADPQTVTIDTVDAEPALTVTKAAVITDASGTRKEKAAVGDTVTYTVTVLNSGNVTVSSIDLTDGMMPSSVKPDAFTLVPGEDEDVTYTYTVTQADVDAGVIHNTAAAAGSDPKGGPVSDSDDEDVPTVDAEPLLAVTKTASKASGAEVNDDITYTITVTNTGNVTVSNISLTDDPIDLSAVEVLVDGKAPDGAWQPFVLAPGASKTISYQYTVVQSDVDRGSIVNTAVAKGVDPKGEDVEPDPATVTVTTITPAPALLVTKTAAIGQASVDGSGEGTTKAETELGDVIEYIVKVKNTGNVTITDIAMADTLVESWGSSVAHFDLAPGVEVELTHYTYRVQQSDVDSTSGKIDNTATATGHYGDQIISDDDDESVEINRTSGLALTKEVVGKTAGYKLGETVSYKIVVTNTGNVTLTNVHIVDTKIGGDWTTTLTPAGAEGSSAEYTGTYTVTAEDVVNGSIVNTVTAGAESPIGPVSAEPAQATVTTEKILLEIKAADGEKIYDGTKLQKNDPAKDWTHVSGDLGGNTITSVELSGERLHVGSAPNTIGTVVISDASGNDVTAAYEITKTPGTLTVNPRPATVTADPAGKVYGENDPELTATVSAFNEAEKTGLIPGETIAYKLTRDEGEDVLPDNGKYVIHAEPDGVFTKVEGSDNTYYQGDYIVTYYTGLFEITPKPLTIEAADATKVYDGTPLTKQDGWTSYALNETGSGLAFGDVIESVDVNGSQTPVGSSENVPSGAVIKNNGVDKTANYTISYVNGTLTVTLRPVTVRADDKSKYWGTPDPKLTWTIDEPTETSGLVGSDTIVPVMSREKAGLPEGEAEGTYVITAAPDAAYDQDESGRYIQGNYAVTYVPGTLTIGRLPLEIKGANKDKTYDGQALTWNRIQAIPEGVLLEGDHIESVKVSGSQTLVGTSANTPSDAVILDAAGNDVTGRYIITYTPGTLEVTKASIIITAMDAFKYFDGTPLTKNGPKDYKQTGLAEGDEITYVKIEGSQTDPGESANVPSAAVILHDGVDVTESCYNITYQNGLLKVADKVSLIITADTDSKEYDGIALVKNSYTYDGLEADDRIESVTITGSQKLAGQSDNVPSAAVIRDADDNDITVKYDITYRNGTLTVTPKPLTITAGGGNKVYDGTALTSSKYTPSGLVNDESKNLKDTITGITITGSQTTVGSSSNVAEVTRIENQAGEDVTKCYAITYYDGTLEVTARKVKIIAGTADKTYDGTALEKQDGYTAAPLTEGDEKSGLLPGDRIDSLQVTGSRTDYGTSDNVPSDAVIVNEAGSDVTANYDIIYVNGSLTVAKRAITITAGSDNKYYDGTPLTKDAIVEPVDNLVTGHKVSSVTVTGSQTKVGGHENNIASNAVISDAGGNDVTGNYDIKYAPGTLKVNPKAITITAASDSKIYDGTPLTKNAYTNSPLAEGDRISQITITGTRTIVGKSDNIPSAANIVNKDGDSVTSCYAITWVRGELEVTKRPIRIIADSAEKVYDGTALTAAGFTIELSDESIPGAPLGAGDSLSPEDITITGSQTVVGKSNNVPSDAYIYDSDGHYANDNYDITYVNGTLEVTKKAVTITAASDSKIYDGTALTKDEILEPEGLAKGDHVETVTVTGSQTVVGKSANKASAAVIFNAAGDDVTASYDISYVDGTLEVTKKKITITADSGSKPYDGTPLKIDTWTNDVLGDGDSVKSVVLTGSQTVFGTSPNAASSAKIVNAAGDDVTASYDISYVDGTLEITKRPITITAASDDKVYDGTALRNSGYSGEEDLAEGDSFNEVIVTGSQIIVGTSDNVPSGAKIVNANNQDVTSSYEITYANGTLEVTPKEITITADSAEKVYDGTPLTKDSYTSTALASGDKIDSVTITGSQTVKGTSDNVPTAAKIVNGYGDDVTASYTITYANGMLEVTPKTVTITADNAEKVYDGTPLTKDTFTNSALAAGDSIESVTNTGSQTIVGSSANVPGSAKIVNAAGDDVTESYEIEYVNGTLTVSKKSVTITAANDTKTYDGTELTNDGYDNTALAEGDKIDSVTVTGSRITAGTSDNVPSAAVIVNGEGDDVTANYEIAYVNGTLEVTPKPLTITAATDTKVYDGTALTNDNYDNTALAEGDSIDSVVVTGSQTKAGSSDNTASAAVIKNADGADVTDSYKITYVKGTLTVTKKALTITAGSASKIYDGQPLTNDTHTDEGLVSGDSVRSVTITGSQTVVGSSYNTASDAVISNTVGEDVTDSYDITYVRGVLEVEPNASLVITAATGKKTYDGTPLVKNAYTTTALVPGDTLVSVKVTGSITTVGTADNIPSEAVIRNSRGEDVTSSYGITYVNGTLEVTPKALTITADSDTKVYDGTPLTKDSYTNTAIGTGDSIESVTVTGSQLNVGTSDNVPSAALILNSAGVDVTNCYDITYANGTLAVTANPAVIITAASDTKTYDGTALTNNGYSSTSLVPGDTLTAVTVTGSRTQAGISENVPSAAVILNSAGENVTANYEITYVNGSLEVTQQPLVITAGSGTKIYDGKELTVGTYRSEGLISGDIISDVTITGSQLYVGTSANVASAAVIMNAAGEDVTASYNITYVDGLLEITASQAISIIAASGSKVYDGTPLVNSGYTSSSLLPGDTLFSVIVRGSVTNVGSMPNIPSAAVIHNAAGEDVTANYTISYVPGMLKVEPRTVTLTADSDSKVYDGTEITDSDYTVVGLAENHSIASADVAGSRTNAGTTSNTIANAVIVNAAGRDVTANYTVRYVNGELEVTPKPITIKAKAGTKVYDGTALTVDDYTATAAAPGDSISSVVLTGSQTNVGKSANVPSAAVIVNGAGADVTGNYTITYVENTLEVTPKQITITAERAEKTYDGKPLTHDGYTFTELAEGDTIKSVVLTGSQKNAGTSANVPSDAVILNAAGRDVTANYEITYVENTLTVNPMPLEITAEDAEKVYDGKELTEAGYTNTDLARGDLIESVTMTGSQLNAGSSVNSPSDAVISNEDNEDVTGNYIISYEDGKLTVTQKPIVIIAASEERIYDSMELTNSDYTVENAGAEADDPNNNRIDASGNAAAGDEAGDKQTGFGVLAEGDLIASVKVEGSRINVGTSPNTASEAVIHNSAGDTVTDNYRITYVEGELTVMPREVTVTAQDQTKEFGQADEPFTAVVEGTLNDDPIVYTITREAGEEPGSYPITPYGSEIQGNYRVIFVPAVMTITYNPNTMVVSKVWEDDNNRDGLRPVSLTVVLSGSDGSAYVRRLNDANDWTAVVEDLPLFYNDSPIEYVWSEEEVSGYTAEVSVEDNLTVFTNTHEISRTSVSVNKVWDDNGNIGGTRPEGLNVRLQRNGVTILAATLNEKNRWSATVNNLPLFENGSPVDYTWTEQAVTGYYPVGMSKTGTATTFTNSNIYTLTIHYIYENGTKAADDHTSKMSYGVTFNVPSPVITGYIADNDVILGTMPAHNTEFTVIYRADGSPDVTPTVVPTVTETPTPVPTLVPHDEPEPTKTPPGPRIIIPDPDHPLVIPEPNILVDIDDLETALGLGEVFINNSGYALE